MHDLRSEPLSPIFVKSYMAGDPFKHHPELRDKIAEPLQSNARNMNLAMMDEKMRVAGAAEDWRHSDTFREENRRQTLNDRMISDLWVFAYGSLMWDPAFRFNEVRAARLQGYRRSFCMKSELGRGTPEKPGLMAGLDIGDECTGLAFQIDKELIEEETTVIWRREMLLHAYEPKFVAVETDQGNLEALAFVVDHTAKSYSPGMSMEETAQYMATGVGIFGSSLTYIGSLAEQFTTIGIKDEALFELNTLSQEMANSLDSGG